jgi:hypothetical protein
VLRAVPVKINVRRKLVSEASAREARQTAHDPWSVRQAGTIDSTSTFYLAWSSLRLVVTLDNAFVVPLRCSFAFDLAHWSILSESSLSPSCCQLLASTHVALCCRSA